MPVATRSAQRQAMQQEAQQERPAQDRNKSNDNRDQPTESSIERGAFRSNATGRIKRAAAIESIEIPVPVPSAVAAVADTAGQSTSSTTTKTTTASEPSSKRARTTAASTDHGAIGDSMPRPPILHSYNLRSHRRSGNNEAKPQTVTPGTVVRQLYFDRSPDSSVADSEQAHQQQQVEQHAQLPPGVINIFDISQTFSSANKTCHCVEDVSFRNNTTAGFAHIANYGEEFIQIQREKENSEMTTVVVGMPWQAQQEMQVIVREMDDCQSPSPMSECNFFDEDDDSDPDSVDEDDSADDEADSNPGTPVPGTVIRGRRQSSKHPQSKCISTAFDESTQPMLRQPFLTPRMRCILVSWLVEVCQEYNISEQAYHLAVTLLDRALARGPSEREFSLYREYIEDELQDGNTSTSIIPFFLVTRHVFQGLGCACLLLAAKLEDKKPPKIEELCYISDRSFTKSTLRTLETTVCHELKFELCKTTPVHFVNQFLRASHACPCLSCQHDHPILRHMVMYLLELSRCSYDLTFCKPSLLAAAAVYLARATLGIAERLKESWADYDTRGHWTKTLEYYTSYTMVDLKDTVLIMHQYQAAAESGANSGSYRKYKDPRYNSVSRRTILCRKDLDFHLVPKNHTVVLSPVQSAGNNSQGIPREIQAPPGAPMKANDKDDYDSDLVEPDMVPSG